MSNVYTTFLDHCIGKGYDGYQKMCRILLISKNVNVLGQ